MEKKRILTFIISAIASTQLVAMEEYTIEDYRKHVKTQVRSLITDPNTINLNQAPTAEQQDIATNIFYCENNTWHNIYVPLKEEFPNLNDKTTTLLLLHALIEKGKSNLIDLLTRSIKGYCLMEEPLDETALSLECYFKDAPSAIGSILQARNNKLIEHDTPELKTLTKIEKLTFRSAFLAALMGKCDQKIIHFILELARAATADPYNPTCTITMPIDTLNMLHQLPFKKEKEICDFIADQNAQEKNSLLRECLKEGILIFFTPAGTWPEKSASVNFSRYLSSDTNEEAKRSKCILQ